MTKTYPGTKSYILDINNDHPTLLDPSGSSSEYDKVSFNSATDEAKYVLNIYGDLPTGSSLIVSGSRYLRNIDRSLIKISGQSIKSLMNSEFITVAK